MIRRLPVVLAALLLSCGGPPAPCTSTTQCGDGQACLDELCRDVDCLSSGDCPIGSTCSAETFSCEPGCATSDDCLIGQRCDVTTATCVVRSCQNTQLDCGLGERCDLDAGQCVDDPEPHCDVCRDDGVCGPTGVCMHIAGNRSGVCSLECSPEAFDPCPSGLQCTAQVTPEGQPAGFRCVGLCSGL